MKGKGLYGQEKALLGLVRKTSSSVWVSAHSRQYMAS